MSGGQDWAKGIQPVRLGDTRREFHHEAASLHLVFDAIEPTREGLRAWVEARWTANPGARLLTFGTYNLMGQRTASALAKAIGDNVPAVWPDGGGPDWRQICNAAVYDIVSEHLVGEEPVDLANVEPEGRPKWLLRPFLTASGSSGLVADGGTGKSLLALSLAFSVVTGRAVIKGMPPAISGPVLYLDWEDDAEEHAERLHAIAEGAGVPIPDGMLHYVQQSGAPLARSATQLEKRVAELGAVLVVVDSTMLARGGDAISAEANTSYHSAIRQLGVPALTVEHKSAEAVRKGQLGVYGSVVNRNSARMLWEFTTVQQTDSGKQFRLEQSKHNRGSFPPMALDAHIVSDDADRLVSVVWRQIPANQVTRLPEVTGATWEQLRDALADGGPMTVDDLASVTGRTAQTVRTTLNRYKDQFHKVPKSSPALWSTGDGPAAAAMPDPF